MLDISFNPSFSYHKDPVGAVQKNELIKIKINITKKFIIDDLMLVYYSDRDNKKEYIPMHMCPMDEYNLYYCEFKVNKPGIYWYFFVMRDCYGIHYIEPNSALNSVLTDIHYANFQLSIYDNFKGDLGWYKGGIMYQILVDRFKNGGVCFKKDYAIMRRWNDTPFYLPVDGEILNNDFFGGDLLGIIEMLDYLRKLNVSVLYLNPIFEAYSNHKYDTGDYLRIDPMFGDDEIFKKLCEEANKRNIKIILDGVFNHTGADSRYFNQYGKYETLGAYQSKDSPYYNWYRFIDYPNKYHCWWGFKTLPAVNQEDQSYQSFICDQVIKKWINLGAYGFRLDVVDELSSKFLNRISKSLKEYNNNAILIGEVWEDASNKIAYGCRRSYFEGYELDSTMNYPFKDAIIDFIMKKDVSNLRNTVRSVINNYPKTVLDSLMNVLSTHDTLRIINALDGNYPDDKNEQANYKIKDMDIAIKRLKMATILQFTLPGVPSIFYGDEAGLEGFKDPFCRRCMPWGNFNDEVFNHYKKLTEIRNEKAYAEGAFQEIYAHKGIYIFKRNNCITLVNAGVLSMDIKVKGLDLFTNKAINGLKLEPISAYIIKGEI